MCKNLFSSVNKFLALIRVKKGPSSYEGAIDKAPVIRMTPFSNPCMCPPCLFQKRVNLEKTQFLPVYRREEGNIKFTTRQISNPYNRHFIEK